MGSAALKKRLLGKTTKTSGCWEWTGNKNEGYGVIKINGKRRPTHRVSYELFVGPIPEGQLVRHSCDNPACVRPAHLSVGTITDNHADMCARGRQSRGSKHYAAKLTEADVQAIRTSSSTGAALARAYHISISTVSAIITRRTWKHVT